MALGHQLDVRVQADAEGRQGLPFCDCLFVHQTLLSIQNVGQQAMGYRVAQLSPASCPPQASRPRGAGRISSPTPAPHRVDYKVTLGYLGCPIQALKMCPCICKNTNLQT